MAYRVEPNARSKSKATVWRGNLHVATFWRDAPTGHADAKIDMMLTVKELRELADELEFRDWAGAVVDCEPQDVDEPAMAMTPPTAPFRWPLCAILRLRRMVQEATR